MNTDDYDYDEFEDDDDEKDYDEFEDDWYWVEVYGFKFLKFKAYL